jgi:hypothetical protein
MAGNQARAVLQDPPFNINLSYDKGSVEKRTMVVTLMMERQVKNTAVFA